MKPHMLIGLIFPMLAIAIWYGPATIWGAQITLAHRPGAEVSADKMDDLAKGPGIVAIFRGRSEMKSLFGEQFSTSRKVSYSARMPFDDILLPGEAMPDPVYFDAYAEARAGMMLSPNCEELLATIARDCETFSSKGRHLASSGPVNALALYADISYIPSYDLGDPSSVKNGRFREAIIGFLFKDSANPAWTRRAVLGRALDICIKLRQNYGNCVIERISFKEGKTRDPLSQPNRYIRSSIVFSVYADDTKVGRDHIEDMAKSYNDALPPLAGES